MVGEFPELQGVMGRYYARHDGEPAEVAAAIAEQYLPRFAGDALPATGAGLALAVADKLDTIVGIFAIGQKPTGDQGSVWRCAARRSGLLRILIETRIAHGPARADPLRRSSRCAPDARCASADAKTPPRPEQPSPTRSTTS